MRRVVLIGRPNVGKSSLFNALLGYRRAIVFDEPGTTRDRVGEKVKWGDVRLIDSQGVFDEMDQKVIDEALADADRVLMVVDGSVGVTPFDSWIASLVKASKKPTLLLVNKSDRRVSHAEEFAELGFDRVADVSAEHRRNLEVIKEFCLEGLGEAEAEKAVQFQMALLGRPNTGKSTLMNLLCAQDVSRVSPEALTTRDPVASEIIDGDTKIRIVDTAGIRRPRTDKPGVEIFSIQASTRMIDESDVIFLMVNAKEGLVDQDMRLLSLIQRSGKPAAILLNFWDRMTREEHQNVLRESEFADFLQNIKVVPLSAKTGYNVRRLIPLAKSLFKRANQRVPTAKLNRIVKTLVQKNPPPSGGKGNFNILYASQTQVHPPTFVFFLNRKAAFPKSYSKYLENQLRSKLALESQSVRIFFRERDR